MTFGSIDDAAAPISSSPASAPAVKPADGVKSFGSVAVQNGVSDAAKSAVTSRPPPLSAAPSTSSSSSQPAPPSVATPSPVPKFDKKSIAKLFQGPSTQSVPAPPHEVASPASRSTSLPSQSSQGQPYPTGFASGSLRQGQNGNPSAPPRSPVYSRPMANGQNGGVGVSGGRPQAGSGGPSAGPTPAAMPSPRLTSHAPPGPPSGLPPPPAMWPGYYVCAVSLNLVTSIFYDLLNYVIVSPSVWCTPRPVLPATMAWTSHPSTSTTPITPPTRCRSTIRGSAYVTTKPAHTITAGSRYPYAIACYSTYSPSSFIRSSSTPVRHISPSHTVCT